MQTLLEIANLALAKLGSPAISAFTEPTAEGRTVNRIYQNVVDAVLRSHHWGFANARVVGAEVDVPTAHAHRAYAYAWPIGCAMVRSITVPEDTPQAPLDFEVVVDNSLGFERKLILCDADEVIVHYSKKLDDVSLYDAIYVDALASRLAAELAIPLTKNAQLRQTFMNEYEYWLGKAKFADVRERPARTEAQDPFLSARFGTVA